MVKILLFHTRNWNSKLNFFKCAIFAEFLWNENSNIRSPNLDLNYNIVSLMPLDDFIMSPGCNMFLKSFMKRKYVLIGSLGQLTWIWEKQYYSLPPDTAYLFVWFGLFFFVLFCFFFFEESIYFTKMAQIQDWITN